MDRSERVKRFMEITAKYDIGNTPLIWDELDKLSDKELYDDSKVAEVVGIIMSYYDNIESNNTRYPESIMRILRQRDGLDKLDLSKDDRFNSYTPNEAFKAVLEYEGIVGFESTIKEWIVSIYGISLDAIR